MKLHIHSHDLTVAVCTDLPHRLSILLAIVPILFLIPLLHVTPALAQGHDHYRGASTHAFPAESVTPIPSPAQLWTKIHNSHMALLRAVPGMSHNDVEYYLKALRGDLGTLSEHPGKLDSQARTSLDVATKRLKGVAKTLKHAVKSNDTMSATVELALLSDELDRIGQLFPASVFQRADGLKLAPLSADPASSLPTAMDELRLNTLPPRTLDVRSKVASGNSQDTKDQSDEVCPMQSGATSGGCSCCGKMQGETKDREAF